MANTNSNNHGQRVQVTCKDCGVSWSKRRDGMNKWKGRCALCSREASRNPVSCKDCGKLVTYTSSRCKNCFHLSTRGKPKTPEHREKIAASNRRTKNNIPVSMPYQVEGRRDFGDKLWRKAVFNRDDFTCKKCKGGKDKTLVAHHILSFTHYPDLRGETDNGITLCFSCHSSFHGRYRSAYHTREDLDAFLSSS